MVITTPISKESILSLKTGDTIEISGGILCGRDAVLPKVVEEIKKGTTVFSGIDIRGQVIFHTAVSPAGVGPTSSNKLEIESSIAPLSEAGVRIHLGKGKLRRETVDSLNAFNSIYAVIPPVTALLKKKTLSVKVVGFNELGMEALYMIEADRFPAIVAAAHGESIYD